MKNDTQFKLDCAMMAPFAVLGIIAQKLCKWTIGGFIVGWEIARRGEKKKETNEE